MAKAKEKSMEATLWDACDKLRGNVEPSEYKHVILSLIFLKYANDRFEEQRENLKKLILKCYLSIQKTMFSLYLKIQDGII